MAATVLEPQKKKTRLMTEGSIWKSILLFSVPLILGNLLQQLYNTADTLIVGGTSLVVYPAAGLLRYFRGRHLVVINMQPTPADESADLCIAQPIGQVLREDVELEEKR